MKKAEKTFFVANLTEELKSAQSFVLVNFAGLAVKPQQELKKRLKEVKAKMIVVKNTLLKRAGEAAKIDPQVLAETILTGQTALIVSESDPIAFIQVLGKFAKEFVSAAGEAVPQMKVGVVEGVFQDPEALAKLATLPGCDALLGQLLGILTSPAQNLVGTLQNPVQKLIYTVNSKLI